MTKQKLKKFMQCETIRGVPIFINEGWVSNGKYALKEDFIDEEQLVIFKHKIEKSGAAMPNLLRAIPDISEYKCLRISDIIIDLQDYAFRLCFYGENERTYINDQTYRFFAKSFSDLPGVEIFALDIASPVVFIQKGDECRYEDCKKLGVIMPLRGKGAEELLESYGFIS